MPFNPLIRRLMSKSGERVIQSDRGALGWGSTGSAIERFRDGVRSRKLYINYHVAI